MINKTSYISEYVNSMDISDKATAVQNMRLCDIEDILKANELYANTLAFMLIKEKRFNKLLKTSMKDDLERSKYIKIIKGFIGSYTKVLIQ